MSISLDSLQTILGLLSQVKVGVLDSNAVGDFQKLVAVAQEVSAAIDEAKAPAHSDGEDA